jgi:hypothetical protein
MQCNKTIRRGVFHDLPARARLFANCQFAGPRNLSGPGDNYIYEWIEEEPPVSYVGPLPYVSKVRRVRRYRTL